MKYVYWEPTPTMRPVCKELQEHKYRNGQFTPKEMNLVKQLRQDNRYIMYFIYPIK